ncbi:MAG: GNAT family N-acetyltransferase [Euzebyales bacterium]|nr:GNAT family N-acetyltransferase [Euzebyales bacterium]
MSDVAIRAAHDDELDDVAALMVDAYAEYAARMSPDAWSNFAHEIANVHGRLSSAELLVAERSGRLVGAVTVFTGWRGAQEGSVGVRLLSVLPAERGSGVGRALMEAAVRRARDAGKDRVVLTTTHDMDAARDLYDSMGFQRDTSLDYEPAPGVRYQGYALRL